MKNISLRESEMPELLPKPEVLRLVANDTLRQLIRTGKLKILADSQVRIGRNIFCRKSAVADFLEAAREHEEFAREQAQWNP